MYMDLVQVMQYIELCAGRAAAADNLWAPLLPTFVDRRATAAENLSARRRCHCCCVLILLQFSMTKKRHHKILRIERNFSGIFEQTFLAANTARAANQSDIGA